MTVRGPLAVTVDVGSAKVCALAGEPGANGMLRILGAGVVPSEGVSRGTVENIQECASAIREALARAERAAGIRIDRVHLAISGAHLQSMNSRGVVAVPDRAHPISAEDVARVVEQAREVSIPTNRLVLHALPRHFVVDGQDNVTDPVGMYGQRLDVEAHVVTASLSAVQNLGKCVEEAGARVMGLVAAPLASAEAVLEDEERKQGVVVADIGSGTTEVAVFMDGSVVHTAVLPIGGYHLTRDLVVGLRTPFRAAEEAKSGYGHAVATGVAQNEVVELEAFGAERQRRVARRRLCEILQARCEELLEMVYGEATRAGCKDVLSAGLVLTGGTARLAGLPDLAERHLGVPARVGVPLGIYGLIDDISGPGYATGVGLLRWALASAEAAPAAARSHSNLPFSNWLRRLGGVARAMLPE